MIRAVLDSNIYVSGLQFGGLAEDILDHLVADRFLCFSSESIRQEVNTTLIRKFHWELEDILRLERSLWTKTVWMTPNVRLKICRDPNDDHLLELCQTSAAEVLVTGDKDLLVLEQIEATEIISLRGFMARLNRTPQEAK